MAEFAVKVERLRAVETHPNADRLELAVVGEYRVVIGKGLYKSNDLVAYIPEASVVPEPIIIEMNLVGKLAGKQANRVKAVRLRGILSQGLCYPAREGWVEGQDVTADIGITKYEPPIPTEMAGQVYGAGFDRTMKYDVENWKRYPDVLIEGEQVVFTEKIHGTWCQIGVVPAGMAHEKHGTVVIASKGMAAQGLAFQPEVEENVNNLYIRANRAQQVSEKLLQHGQLPVFALGEVFGQGVQDLHYGASAGKDEKLGFRVFDIYVGLPGQGRYLDDAELTSACETLGLYRVPVLYRGPYSREVMLQFTTGKESVSGNGMHLREGIVMKPLVERRDDHLGRVMLKSISEDYLTRSGATEYT